MNWFSGLFGRKPIEQNAVALTDPAAFELFGVVPTVAGPAINAATALRVPAVYSALALISGAIGSLPAKVFRSGTSGKRAAKDHPTYALVHDWANEWTSAGKLRSQLTADALLFDHGFAYANRVDGRVVEFIRLDPRSVTIEHDAASGEPYYIHRPDKGRQTTYSFRDVLHVSAPLDLSPIKAGREAIGLANILERHAAQLFASGARPSALFYNEARKGGADGSNGASIVKGIKAAYRAATASISGFTEPMVLDDGWRYEQMALTSADAQFAEMRTEQVVEIARLFRIPPHLLFELSRATWSNAEEMFQSFLTLTLRSWLDEWEAAYARVLFTPEERADLYVEFVVDDLLTANAATRATTYGQYRSMGAMTANEVRAGLNMPPVDGGDTLANPNITPGKPTSVNDNPAPAQDAAA